MVWYHATHPAKGWILDGPSFKIYFSDTGAITQTRQGLLQSKLGANAAPPLEPSRSDSATLALRESGPLSQRERLRGREKQEGAVEVSPKHRLGRQFGGRCRWRHHGQ